MSRFSIIPAKALSDRRVSRTDLAVLNALGQFQNDKNGWSWPSYNELSKVLGMSRRTVMRSMDHLATLGYVEKRSTTRKNGALSSNQYRILFDFPDNDADNTPSPPSDNFDTTPLVTTLTPPSDIALSLGGVKAMSLAYVKEPSEGTQLTPPPSERANAKKILLEELSIEHLTEWIEQRKVTAKTPLDVNIELCLEQMKAHYLANGGMDGAGRRVVDWVEKAKRWILEEQKNLKSQRSRRQENPAAESRNDVISHSFYNTLLKKIERGGYLSRQEKLQLDHYNDSQPKREEYHPITIKKEFQKPPDIESQTTAEERNQVLEGLRKLTEDLRSP